MLHGEIGVGGLHDCELAVLLDQPGPAGTELGETGVGDLGLELIERAEVGVDAIGEHTGGGATAVGRQAVPEEGVVPDLGRVVEQAGLGAHDDLLERLRGVVGAVDQLVEVVDVGLVVLAVVVLEGLGADVRGEGILGVRKGGKFEGHGGLFLIG